MVVKTSVFTLRELGDVVESEQKGNGEKSLRGAGSEGRRYKT